MNKKTYDHQQLISIHEIGLDIKNREIYLHSDTSTSEEEGVEYKSAIRFEKNIRILESISKEAILVHMHLPGGDWSDCFGIYDTIKSCKSRIIILAYAKVESSSSIILQSADTRILMPNSYVRLSAGRSDMSNSTQALAFMAGANSIFQGDVLLTANNPEKKKDNKLFKQLGMISEKKILEKNA